MKLFAFLCCICLVLGLPLNDPLPNKEADGVAQPTEQPIRVSRVPASLNLPSNATSIRADITDNFSCQDRIYGYYADVENECQIFHICLPVTYADGKEKTFRWSFVCPDETIFSQEHFTCIRPADWAGNCADSEKFVELNQQFGKPSESGESDEENKDSPQPESDAAESVPKHLHVSHLNTVPKSLISGPVEETIVASKSKSYGLVNVLDDIDNQLAEEYKPIGALSSESGRKHIEETPIAGSTETAITTEVPAEDASYESTVSWNVYTESLYDGFTIDDNVEVDAIEVTEESSSSAGDTV